jgi:hypothetical protein
MESKETTVRVFVSRTELDLDRAEAVLREIDAEYEVSLEGVPEEVDGSSVCYQRLVIRVGTPEEQRSRQALARAGLG